MSSQATNVTVHDESHASLQLVSREIANELNEARSALEAFAENPAERGALHRFAAHIHLARGALRLAEVYGGALLAEEMEQVARYVDTHSGAGQADADGLDALMRAMEQLPSYVDRVASGGRGVLTVESGIDAPAELSARATQSLPRLRAAFSEVTQRMANETRAGAPPDVLRLSRELQAEVDRVMGRAGARVLLGTVMLN